MSATRRFLLALRFPLGAALLASTFPAAALPPDRPANGETFFESIDVNVVNVDVVVTDKSGRRVTGLTRQDFELLEDGRPVEVTNFYAVAGSEAAAPAPGAPAEEAVPEAQRLYLTLFFDNRNLPAAVRNRLLPPLEQFLASRLRPSDQILLASYDGDLEIRQQPTRDSAALLAALKKMARQGSRGTHFAMDRKQLLFQINSGEQPGFLIDASRPGAPNTSGFQQTTAEEDARELLANVRSLAEREHLQTRSTLQTMAQLVDSLSGLPGRKVLLYVGGGISMRPSETLLRAWINKYRSFADNLNVGTFDTFEQESSKLFEQLVARANSHRVTFYTLGAPANSSRTSPEFGDNPSYTHELQAIERVNATTPLDIMAAGTGGLSSFDALDPATLVSRMREDLGSYYSLGYVPFNRADGKNHKIEVVPRDRSLAVRHRETFRAQTTAERATSRTLAAMVLGVADNPLEISLDLEPESRDKQGNLILPVLVKLPFSKLVLLPQDDVHAGRLRLFVGSRDERGRLSPITEIRVPIRISNEQLLTALGQSAAVRVRLTVRDGAQTIAVSVHDEVGNVDSTATAAYKGGPKVADDKGAADRLAAERRGGKGSMP